MSADPYRDAVDQRAERIFVRSVITDADRQQSPTPHAFYQAEGRIAFRPVEPRANLDDLPPTEEGQPP